MEWYILLIAGVIFTKNCASEDTIFIATKNVIRSCNLTQFDSDHTIYVPIEANNIACVDYDPVDKYVYWADKDSGNINKAKLDGSDSSIVYTASNPTSLALDIVNRVVYWTDTDTHTIEKVSFDGRDHEKLITSDLDRPMSVIVDVKNQKLYWSEVGEGPRIEEASLDGTERRVLVNSSDPRTLTLDVTNKRLYWVDNTDDNVMYSDLDGDNVQELLRKENVTASDLVVYGDKIYCSDTGTTPSQVWAYDVKNGEGNVDVILTLANWKFSGIYATKSESNEEIMFVAQDHGIMELDLSVERGLGKQIPGLADETPLGITYDRINSNIYWITKDRELKRANRNGTDVQTVASTKAKFHCVLLFNEKTSELFWSEKNKKRIRKLALSDNTISDVVNGDLEIIGLDLDTENGYVYFVESDLTAGKIRRVAYKSTSNIEDIETDLHSPTAVVVDTTNNIVYWSETDSSTIQLKNADGTKSSIPAKKNIRYMTKLGNNIYWYTSKEILGITNLDDTTTAILRTKVEREFKSLKIIPDIFGCETNPCQNGGECRTEPYGYSCSCTPGYTGWDCETFISNSCDPNPCKNGGICLTDNDGYKCTCTEGFEGDNCETVSGNDECANDPCKNGGTCVASPDSYSCTCLPGFGGDNCQTDLGQCDSNPCENGGTCISDSSGYKCSCVIGFIGDNCEIDLGQCASNPCKNGGTCISDSSGYKCSCVIGFIGDSCEIDLVYIAVVIPIVPLIALIAYYVKKILTKRQTEKTNHSPQGAPITMYEVSDVIVQPMYI